MEQRMSQPPFGSPSRSYGLDSAFNERAGPRMPGRWYRHPVIPISSTDAPHYAQASQLYPMHSVSGSDNSYRYKPGSLGPATLHTDAASSSGQAVVIPVLHHNSSRSSNVSHGSESNDSNSCVTQIDNSDNLIRASYRTGSALGSGGRPSVGRATVPCSDPEAEVDALTNLLMQSMEIRPNYSTLGSSGSSAYIQDAITSPGGSLRRGVGLNSQLGRLQQHVGLGYGSTSNSNGGRGSPSTTATNTGGSNTNSPTGSSSSIHNTPEGSANITHTGTVTSSQNACFRCRRPFVPPEGSTHGSAYNSANNLNVVSLTGALGVRLHVACFTCYRCAAPLKTDAYYHNLRRLLCPTCVRDGAVESCSNCHRPIGDRVVHALGLPYHPSCFVCVVCAGRLDSRPFTIDVHQRLHCLTDFHKRYAPRCASCRQPIVPEPGCHEAKRVVSGNSNYHLECFDRQLNPQTSGIKSAGHRMTHGIAT